jgi:hypothetical protein
MAYVIKRTDQGGGYVVALAGSHKAYTHNLQKARFFATRDKAELRKCPKNEIVLYVSPIEQNR